MVGVHAQEVGRLFCGSCGNAALQKVEVVVGPQGTEQYGVRKKHILRGTRFPLPKPKVHILSYLSNYPHPPLVILGHVLSVSMRGVRNI